MMLMFKLQVILFNSERHGKHEEKPLCPKSKPVPNRQPGPMPPIAISLQTG
jgi:hypothetical protein